MKKVIFNTSAVLLTVFAFAMVSCNQTNNNHKTLLAHEWVLESIIDNDREALISVPDNVTITFSDSSRVFGNAGCNNFNGMYETEAYNQIGMSRLATTQMWCFNMDFETDYLARLEKVVSYEATPEKLELNGTGNSFRMVYLPRNKPATTNR